MNPYIKNNKYLLICLFTYLFIYSSCNSKKESKNNEKAETPFELKTEGKWKLVKSAKIGAWENDVEYYYNQEQLKGKYTKTVIGFSRYYITIDGEPYCGGDNILIGESLDFNINETDEERKIVKDFLNNEFQLSENSFRGLYNLDCEHPFNKIFDFGDKLLVREWGTYYYLFEKIKEVKQDVKVVAGYDCKEIETRETIYEEPLYKICICDYEFLKCYSFFYNNIDDYYKKMLLKSLPEKDTVVYFTPSLFSFTEYKIFRRDSIKIIIHVEGGESEYIFKKDSGKTRIEFYAYPP